MASMMPRDLVLDAGQLAVGRGEPLALFHALAVLFLAATFVELRYGGIRHHQLLQRVKHAAFEFVPRNGPAVRAGAALLVAEAAQCLPARQVVAGAAHAALGQAREAKIADHVGASRKIVGLLG